jgi:hypothetical protein
VGTVTATDNSFCDISDPTVITCRDVPVQKTAFIDRPEVKEFVVLSGTIHVAVFEDPNDPGNQARIRTNWQDVGGIGALTGTIYQANEATRIYEVEWPSGGFSFVLQDERKDERTLVSKGGLQNFIFWEHFAITTDPFKVNERSEMKCSG